MNWCRRLVLLAAWCLLAGCGAGAGLPAAQPAALPTPAAVISTGTPTPAPLTPSATPVAPAASAVTATATDTAAPRPPAALATRTPSAPAGTPTATPTIVYFPIGERVWDKIPTVVISAVKNDARIPLVQKAVNYWNQQLKAIGVPFHVGAVTQTTELVPAQYLIALGTPDTPGQASIPELPVVLAKMSGDLIVALSDADFVSFTHPSGTRKLIAIQVRPGGMDSPLVDQNVIAHEMGHAIGLGHNDDPTKLMCGRPAPCRPDRSWLAIDGFLPITEVEKAYLKKIYPGTWKPAH